MELPDVNQISCLEMVSSDRRTLGVGYTTGRVLLLDIITLTYRDFTQVNPGKGSVRAIKMYLENSEELKNSQKAVLVAVIRKKYGLCKWRYTYTKTLLRNKNTVDYFKLEDFEEIATEVQMPFIVSDAISGFESYRAKCGKETLLMDTAVIAYQISQTRVNH